MRLEAKMKMIELLEVYPFTINYKTLLVPGGQWVIALLLS